MKRRRFLHLTIPGAIALTKHRVIAANAEPAVRVPAAKPFVHPGLLHSREELEFIKQKAAAGEEPWKTVWDIYERIVYHYYGRKGLEMPHCREVIAKSGLEMPHCREVIAKSGAGGRSSGAHVPWGALMFAELPRLQSKTK